MSGIEGAMFVHAGGFVAYTLDREAAIMVRSFLYFWLGFLPELKLSNNNRSESPVCLQFIDAAIAEDHRRKEEMSEIMKKQEINDVVKNLRRLSIRAYK